MKIFFMIILFIVSGRGLYGEDIHPQPIETGVVAWGRDFNAALIESDETGKPVLILFQEQIRYFYQRIHPSQAPTFQLVFWIQTTGKLNYQTRKSKSRIGNLFIRFPD